VVLSVNVVAVKARRYDEEGLPQLHRSAMRVRSLSLILVLMLSLAVPTPAWWEVGHRTVARLAAERLTPQARSRVATLLGVPDDTSSVADALAAASTWADEVKGPTKTGTWHYIDLTLQDKKSDFAKRCENDDCVTARIRLFREQLAGSRKDPKWSDVEALKFVVHFVGDLEQPLHATSDADQGGNCERLDPAIDTAHNLHALWDGGMLKELTDDDRALVAQLDVYANGLSRSQRKHWAKGDEMKWAWESHELGEKVIYKRLNIPLEAEVFPSNCDAAPAEIQSFKTAIDKDYIAEMQPVIREQLTKGGLRLAAVLNQSLQ